MKNAVLSLDVEDWYHLDYFERGECDQSYSLLDGLSRYVEVLESMNLQSSFFVLGELASRLAPDLKSLSEGGHDVGCHGWNHRRPLTMDLQEFEQDLVRSRDAVADATGQSQIGYRAPCFSLDRARLEKVIEAGFTYDSSLIEFGDHPLNGTIDMSGFESPSQGIYLSDEFAEFEVSTLSYLRRNIPVSAGGYLRIFPWLLMRHWLQRYLKDAELYVLYIHPFELSTRAPNLPNTTSVSTRARFSLGRGKVEYRLNQLIELLNKEGYRFTTFRDIHAELNRPGCA